MMNFLKEHPYFEKWQDPESGIISYILDKRVAPIQQSFYFTNSSVSPDEKWLWFYTSFPPAPGQHSTLGAVSLDPDNPEIIHLPNAAFSTATPMIGDKGNYVYYGMGNSVWKHSLEGKVDKVCTLSDEYINNRVFNRLATHLTISADEKYFLLDGSVGNKWFVALGNRETGQVKILKEFSRHYNHAQFSTRDPELFLIAQDWWHDPISGEYYNYDHRTWIMDIKQTKFQPICPEDWNKHTANPSHEWWSQDGLICWVDYKKGVYEYDLATGEKQKVWQGPLCHAHSSSDRRFWCADESPYKWEDQPCQVLFYDREQDQEINIVTGLPKPPFSRNKYHIDPHPQFSPEDSWIVYTTTVRNKVDVALTPVNNIKKNL